MNKRVKLKSQDTPLHLAARRGHVHVLMQLAAAGAHLMMETKGAATGKDVLEVILNDNAQRQSPLDVAVGDARLFLEDAVQLFRLCEGGAGHSSSSSSSSIKSIKSILASSLTRYSLLNFRTTSNNTPLHIAARSNNRQGWCLGLGFGVWGLGLQFWFGS